MTSIERTAYPRFGRLVTARELTGMSPSADEVTPLRVSALSWPYPYQDDNGVVRHRDRELTRDDGAVAHAGEADRVPDAELDYRLATDVPANWIPYAPMSQGLGLINLRRAEVDGQAGHGPKGRVVAETPRLVDSEVPLEGVQVLQVPAVARRAPGTWARWIGRRVTVGRGEGSSGLQYDGGTVRPRERAD